MFPTTEILFLFCMSDFHLCDLCVSAVEFLEAEVSRRQLLIVDDEPNLLESFKIGLELKGSAVHDRGQRKAGAGGLREEGLRC